MLLYVKTESCWEALWWIQYRSRNSHFSFTAGLSSSQCVYIKWEAVPSVVCKASCPCIICTESNKAGRHFCFGLLLRYIVIDLINHIKQWHFWFAGGYMLKMIAGIQTVITDLLAYNLSEVCQTYLPWRISSHLEPEKTFLSQVRSWNQFLAK